MHLLIPFAACLDPQAQALLRELRLPHLQRLLSRLQPTERDTGTSDSLSPPHERVLAHWLGLSAADGLIAWAANQGQPELPDGTSAAGAAWGWITPCHWQVGRDQMHMDPPAALGLQESESRALLAAMQPYFEEDGIHLRYANPTCWLARSERFNDLATASLDRVIGHDPAHWLPRGAAASVLRRLQNEMQMLLYTHPVNELRLTQGKIPVNSFWLSGSGSLPAVRPATSQAADDAPQVPRALADAALRQDWPAWAQAWETLDATACADLLRAVDQTPWRTGLTLCGERNAQTYGAPANPWLARARYFFSRTSLTQQLDSL